MSRSGTERWEVYHRGELVEVVPAALLDQAVEGIKELRAKSHVSNDDKVLAAVIELICDRILSQITAQEPSL